MTPPILYAPASYKRASDDVRRRMVNGCGPGGWKVDIIPDTVWGLSIEAACNIHDWMYSAGSTIEDKREADRVFLNNMLRIVNHYTSNRILLWLRRRRVFKYYEAVHLCGGPAFWKDKNKPEEEVTEWAAQLNWRAA